VPIPPRSLKEPPNPEPQTCQSPPEGRAMNIRQCRGNSFLDNPSFPYMVPVSQALFLAVGMFMPAPALRGLGTTEEHPSYAHRPASPR
jgi:hypothetical protein